MNRLPKAVSSREEAAALIIVLAFVVLLTGLAVAYLTSRDFDATDIDVVIAEPQDDARDCGAEAAGDKADPYRSEFPFRKCWSVG